MYYANRRRVSSRFGLILAACIALVGCGGGQPLQPVSPLPVATLAPDFSLPDVNPNSATSGHNVSPRTHLGAISAWYFGHAT